MQKLCSVTLSSQHVYACLVCGRFFQGRGKHTHAYTHSLEAGHHVFMSVDNGRVWCLPDSYEVYDASLDDIRFALNPVYSDKQIREIDANTKLASDISGSSYLPGFVGINNLKHTDYASVVLHALAHVKPLRDYFLKPSNYAAAAAASALVKLFGEFIRKLWSPAAFKSTVSPIELLTEVSVRTKKRFTVGEPAEAVDFLVWLLNTLHSDLTAKSAGTAASEAAAQAVSTASSTSGAAAAVGQKRPRPEDGPASATSIITDVFQGELEVETLYSEIDIEAQKEKAKKEQAEKEAEKARKRAEGLYVPEEDEEEQKAAARGTGASKPGQQAPAGAAAVSAKPAAFFKTTPKTQRIPYLFLSLDLPPAPLYRDEHSGGIMISQIPLYTLLSKYDGEYVTDSLKGQFRERKRYRIIRLPPYMIMTVKRFSKNAFFTEKNSTVVNFPVRNLEMKPYLHPTLSPHLQSSTDASSIIVKDPITGAPLPDVDSLDGLRVADLKAIVRNIKQTMTTMGAAAAGGKPSEDDEDGGVALEKSELVSKARQAITSYTAHCLSKQSSLMTTKYDLCANVVSCSWR
jgi:U4/U6.U5 tri-snRNP-associated protein 2